MTIQTRLEKILTPRHVLSPEERGQESVNTALTLFGNPSHFPFIQKIIQMPKYCAQDMQGIDLVFVIKPDSAQILGIDNVNVQIKSSESGVYRFITHGIDTKVDWYNRNQMVLNCGEWSSAMIHADFVAQLANLVGIFNRPNTNNSYEMGDFLNLFPPEILHDYISHRDLILQYRQMIFEHVVPCHNGHC